MDGPRAAIVVALLCGAFCAGMSRADEPRWQFVELTDTALPSAERPGKRSLVRLVDEPTPVRLQTLQPPAESYRPAVMVAPPSSRAVVKLVEKPTAERVRAVPVERTASPIAEPSTTVPMSANWPGKIFVTGEVQAPGELSIDRPTTAVQAIAAAGGVRESAKADRVAVLRYRQAGEAPALLVVDLERTLGGRGRRDCWLQPGDVVVVPKQSVSAPAEIVDQYLYKFLPANRTPGYVNGARRP